MKQTLPIYKKKIDFVRNEITHVKKLVSLSPTSKKVHDFHT